MEIVREERRGVLFYVCPEMREAGFPHGFSTRVGGVSPAPWDSLNLGGSCGDDPERVSENFRRFCAAIGTDPDCLVKNQQVHGDRVRLVTRADRMAFPGEPGTVEADGLMTREAGVCLAAFSADCIPVLLCDPVTGAAAAVHAGWRGTALGIAARGWSGWRRPSAQGPGTSWRPWARASPPAALRPTPMCPTACGLEWALGRSPISTPSPARKNTTWT